MVDKLWVDYIGCRQR